MFGGITVSYQRSHLLGSACAAILALAANSAFAQQAGPTTTTALEEVVVTGSLIKGTPTDTALPVEVISEQDLVNLGRPSNLDLVKTMSEVGQVAGEAYRYNGYPIGAATINLRNLGARYTTVVFNGRRFPEQYSVATGRFNNINWIPNAAIGSVEVLKEGGAVTYGADAVGGVVNYITRRDLEGMELNADYRYIKDSSGDYDTDFSWGKKINGGNVLVVAGYQHRGYLAALDRDFSKFGSLENRTAANWVASGSPGSYAFLTTATGAAGTISPFSGYTGDRQMSISGLVRDPNCNTLGGFSGWSTTPSPACYLQISQFEALQQEENQYQLYAEFNKKLGESMDLHMEGMYYQQDLPNINTYPGDSPGSFPLVTGTGTTQTAGTSSAYFVSGRNPAVAQFLNNFYNSNGTTTAYTPAQIAAITSVGRAALVTGIWRPFGNGGNPLYGKNDSQHNNNKLVRLTADLKGDLWDTGLQWDVGITYSHVKYSVETHDVLVDRLQAALNGLGGSTCNGIQAGSAGSTCQWFNPFSSAIPSNIYSGAANPGYVPALANSPDLVSWLYVPIALHRAYDYLVVDSLVSGKTGWILPGGPVAVAAGVQYRYTGEEFLIDDLSNQALNPCATPGVMTCTTPTGPLAYGRNSTVLGTTLDIKRHYPVAAAYAEAQFPILDTLDLQLAARYEKFYSDITDTDNSVVVPAAAIKWQALDWFAVRTSAGQTFSQVNPPKDDGPIATVVATNTQFGINAPGYTTYGYDNVGVKPEKGKYFSAGFVVRASNFTGNVDYFNIRIEDKTRTMSSTNTLLALIGKNSALTTDLLDCTSPMFVPQAGFAGQPFVVLPGGCAQGVTTVGSLGAAGTKINYYAGTDQVNSGELKTAGFDLSANYRFDSVVGGTLTPSVDLTYNTEWKLGDFILGDTVVSKGYDGLGYKNNTTDGRLGLAVPKWRGSLGLNYRNGRHNLNILATYTPSIVNEDPSDFDASNDQNANIGNTNGVVTTGTTAATAACTVPGVTGTGITTGIGNVPAGAGTGQFGSASVNQNGTATTLTRGFCGTQNASVLSGDHIAGFTNVDLNYRIEILDNLAMSLTINNLLDREPSFDRSTAGYNPGFGSPLLRNYKLSVHYKF